jgi:predicted nucleotidyltransferase
VDDQQIDLIVRVVLAWATAQPKIRAVALIGSHARGTARADSDIDLMLLATDPDSFRVAIEWVEQIDWYSIDARPQNWQDENYDAVWSRRIWLAPHSRELELSFAHLSWTSVKPIDAETRRVISEGCRILYDPDALLVRLCNATDYEIQNGDRRHSN